MSAPLKVLFLGTPEFALPSFCALDNCPDVSVVGVITQPDRPAGRGCRLSPPPVKTVAQERGIPVLQPQRLKENEEALKFCRNLRPDLGVVVAFGQILPRVFFELPRYGTLNLHASLLPKYRGAAPLQHAILNGETETGVTIMKIDAGLDSGDLLTSRTLALPAEATAGDLSEEAARIGAELLVATIPGYVSGSIQPRPQEDRLATYAPRLAKEEARIEFTRPAARIHDQIRAFNPRPIAFTSFRTELLKVWSSRVESCPAEGLEWAVPGTVVGVGGDGILVRCGEGFLRVLELQLAGRKRLSARDFINGVGLQAGEIFT